LEMRKHQIERLHSQLNELLVLISMHIKEFSFDTRGSFMIFLKDRLGVMRCICS
jgi:hypothetical protein